MVQPKACSQMAPVYGGGLKCHAREIWLLVIISEQKPQLPCNCLLVQISSPLKRTWHQMCFGIQILPNFTKVIMWCNDTSKLANSDIDSRSHGQEALRSQLTAGCSISVEVLVAVHTEVQGPSVFPQGSQFMCEKGDSCWVGVGAALA